MAKQRDMVLSILVYSSVIELGWVTNLGRDEYLIGSKIWGGLTAMALSLRYFDYVAAELQSIKEFLVSSMFFA